MRKLYNAKMHPDVIREIKTEDDVMREMLQRFKAGPVYPDDELTLEDFEQYYAKIGASLSDEV